MPDPLDQFNTALRDACDGNSLVRLQFTNPRVRDAQTPRTQSVRPVRIKQQELWQWSLQFDRQQTHLNLDADQTLARTAEQFPALYRDARLSTSEFDLSARVSGNEIKLIRRAGSGAGATPTGHDRTKQRLIPEGVPCPFLIALDVMTPQGQVHSRMQKKFRQINRYLELVEDVLPSLPAEGPLRVIDFGCGLSYLTFAVHHLLTSIHSRSVDMLGIDRDEHVVQRCRKIAADFALPGIRFETGTIQGLENHGPVHLAISLHACDTATDDALAFAVSQGANVILAAPCCQHELAAKLPPGEWPELLKHGILKERFAALATDALRAAALSAAGYRTQIIEFIDLEHTPKNLLIRAVRRRGPGETGDREEYDRLKQQLRVHELATDRVVTAAASHPPPSQGEAGGGSAESRGTMP